MYEYVYACMSLTVYVCNYMYTNVYMYVCTWACMHVTVYMYA